MPQIFQVLRCFKCLVFQVHQTKKSNKWQCKLCGEKQSVKRHYGLGNGKECRLHVQKLNKLRGVKEEVEYNLSDTNSYEYDEDDVKNPEVDLIEATNDNNLTIATNSKWETFVDKSEYLKEIDEPIFFNNKEVVLEIPYKRKCTTPSNLIRAKFSNKNNCTEEIETSNEIKHKINKSNMCLKTEPKPKMKKMYQKATASTQWGNYMDETEKQCHLDLYSDSFQYCNEEFSQKPQQQKCIASKPIRECFLAIEQGKLSNLTKNKVANREIHIENVKKSIDTKSTGGSHLNTKETKTNSLWNKYLEDDENNSVIFRTDKTTDNAQSMFSLCEDDDIDNVLDF